MKFLSLSSLTPRQLLMYWIIGFGFGYLVRGIIGDFLITLGWICLIWAGIKWFKEAKERKRIVELRTKIRMEERGLDKSKDWQKYYEIRGEEEKKI